MKKLMHLMMLSCLRATELIEKKVQITLNIKEKIQLKLHMSVCKACKDYETHSAIIDKALSKNNVEIDQKEIAKLKMRITEQLKLN